MLSQEIREYAGKTFIQPARLRGDATVSIRVGDVHRDMGLNSRVPAVCQALTTKSFLSANHLVLEDREGPPSGQGTNVVFHYRFAQNEPAATAQIDKWDRLLGLRGIAPRGMGEAVRRERAALQDLDDKSQGDPE